MELKRKIIQIMREDEKKHILNCKELLQETNLKEEDFKFLRDEISEGIKYVISCDYLLNDLGKGVFYNEK